MRLIALVSVIICVYSSPVERDTSDNYVVESFQEEPLTKRFLVDTDFHSLPVYHVGSSKCEPVSATCDSQYATAFRHNGTIFAYCCSEMHKPHVTIHPDGIECDC